MEEITEVSKKLYRPTIDHLFCKYGGHLITDSGYFCNDCMTTSVCLECMSKKGGNICGSCQVEIPK